MVSSCRILYPFSTTHQSNGRMRAKTKNRTTKGYTVSGPGNLISTILLQCGKNICRVERYGRSNFGNRSGTNTELKAVSSKYYPFKESKRKLREDLFILRFTTGLEATEREAKGLPFRQSMDELE